MDWLNQFSNILQQYSTGAAPAKDVESHFDQVAQAAPQSTLAEGLTAAFASSQTPSPASMVSQLFSQSNDQQRAGLLNTLIGSAGPAIVSQMLARGGLSSLANELGAGQTQVTPEQASQVSPELVEQIAAHAQTQDESLLTKLGDFYSAHPTLVKSLGAAALTIALSKIARR
jgi:hypothetical protein